MSESPVEEGVAVNSIARQRLQSLSWPLVATLAILVLDRITKIWALADLAYQDKVIIPNLLFLDLAKNPGAAFSLFSEYPMVLTGMAALLACVIAVWIWNVAATQKATSVALGLVLGGAIGNLIDRIMYQQVTDFIRVHIAPLNWSWPTFNIADSGICIGMALLLWTAFFPPKASKPAE